jgi:hypothetical protein
MAGRRQQVKQPVEPTFTIVRHFPVEPFGRFAGQYCIEHHVATSDGSPHCPLRGCELKEQLEGADKELLCYLGLANLSPARKAEDLPLFEVYFGRLRAHLRAVCRLSDVDIAALSWRSLIDLLLVTSKRPRHEPSDVALTPDELEVLSILEEQPALCTIPTMDRMLRGRRKPRSETCIKTIVRRLCELRLAQRPRPRMGASITPAGIAYLVVHGCSACP